MPGVKAANGYGMKQGKGINQEFTILVTTASGASTATWTVSSCTSTNFKTGSTITWGTTGSGDKDTTKVGVTKNNINGRTLNLREQICKLNCEQSFCTCYTNLGCVLIARDVPCLKIRR